MSPDLISTVTDGIVADVTAWQTRPLEGMYPVVFSTPSASCIIDLVRHRLDYASWKDRNALAAARRPIYTAPYTRNSGQSRFIHHQDSTQQNHDTKHEVLLGAS